MKNINIEYVRVIGIMASLREIVSTYSLISYELAPHQTAMFADNGEIWETSKSVLKNKLQIPSEERNADPPVVTIVDGWDCILASTYGKSVCIYHSCGNQDLELMDTTQMLHVVFDRYNQNNQMSIKSASPTARQDRCSRVFTMKDEVPIPGQAMALNVAANKAQLIHLLTKHLCKLIVPYGKRLVVTGPDPHMIEVGVGILLRAITHEEAGIIMTYNMIEESLGGQSPIRIVSDDTGVLTICTHQPQARANKLPASVKVTMEACSGRHKVIGVNAIVKQHVAVIPQY